MTWTKTGGENWPQWFCGIYKITRYESSISDRLGIHYRAYYKPKGWKNWGNYVDAGTPYYLSLKAAQAACVRHLKETHVEAQAC